MHIQDQAAVVTGGACVGDITIGQPDPQLLPLVKKKGA
jgi:hypothetical protein